jgi:hypothetical protein
MSSKTYADNGSTEWHDLDRLLSAHLSDNSEQPEGKSTELDHPGSWRNVVLGSGMCIIRSIQILSPYRRVLVAVGIEIKWTSKADGALPSL